MVVIKSRRKKKSMYHLHLYIGKIEHSHSLFGMHSHVTCKQPLTLSQRKFRLLMCFQIKVSEPSINHECNPFCILYIFWNCWISFPAYQPTGLKKQVFNWENEKSKNIFSWKGWKYQRLTVSSVVKPFRNPIVPQLIEGHHTSTHGTLTRFKDLRESTKKLLDIPPFIFQQRKICLYLCL